MITTRLYLDTRQSKEGKPAPLKISIFHRKQVAYISTGIKVLPSSWDPVTLTTKDKATMLTISRFKLKVDTLLLDLLEAGKLDGLSASDIRNLVARCLNPSEAKKMLFMECLRDFAATRKKPRTREIYQTTIKRILEFDAKAAFFTFDDITFGWLDRFDAFLAKTAPKKNSRNIHFRNIKAVYNDARKKKFTQCYPFLDFKVRPAKTAHKTLSVEQLRDLFNAEVLPWQQKYVDFFKISFMLIGMNTEDLLHATGISGGRIEYNRAKTDKPYNIKVEDECRRIIEKYKGKEYMLNILDTYSSTHYWTSKVDRELKTIANDLGLPRISMIWARHTWATIAADLDIPKETVAAALGHSSNTVTDIYISFDRNKIDQANRKVMDYVLHDKRPEGVLEMIHKLNSAVSELARNANYAS